MDKKINIGLFCDSFFPMVDGVINVVNNYATRLTKYSNVTVFVPQGRETYEDNFCYKVVRCKKRFKCPGLDYDLPMPEIDSDFMQQLKESKLDLVHIHSPFSMGKLGLRYAKKHKIPCIATCHSQFKKDFYEATKSKALTAIAMGNIMPTFEKCDECWAVNKEVAKLYHDEYKLKITPKVKNNGTEMKFYKNQNVVLSLKKQLNISDEEKVLLFVGRLHILKNILFIADALKILKDKNFKYKMIFVGKGPDEDKLKQKLHDLNLDDNVLFAGKISDRDLIAQYYQLADLFIFPSLYDCSSLVQIEAASQKTPTLFLRGSVTSGTCTEGEDAYFSDNDPIAYADKVIEIFSNKEEYQRICEGAYRNLFVSWDDAVEKIFKDYLEVIEKFNDGFYEKYKTFVKNKKANVKKVVSKRKKTAIKYQKKEKTEQEKLARKELIAKEKIEKIEKQIEKQTKKLEKLKSKL